MIDWLDYPWRYLLATYENKTSILMNDLYTSVLFYRPLRFGRGGHGIPSGWEVPFPEALAVYISCDGKPVVSIECASPCIGRLEVS